MIRLAALFALGGCVAQENTTQPLTLNAVDFSSLQGWRQEDIPSVISLLRVECNRMQHLPSTTFLGGSTSITYGRHAGDWSGACRALELQPEAGRDFVQAWFQPYALTQQAFYTGYYEPQIQASLSRFGEYQVPVYARPSDLMQGKTSDGHFVSGHMVNGRFAPYYSREEIDQGVLSGKGLEIAWLKDPVDLFFLQIQGSGRLILPDGRQMRVSYDGRNGQPYVPLGRVLVREGKMQSSYVNMDNIRAWLNAHPEQRMSMMEKNPNYVFFRASNDNLEQGSKGAFGVNLTAGRSVAIDRKVLPFGLPLWVQTTLPNGRGAYTAWQHMVFAQDIGTDIKGVGRSDLYTGWGAQAHEVAGNLHASGQMFVFLPRPPASASTP
ncbi:murein transglycosylase A [Swingsia samuiensis]|nr:murein transglycosylase A [Swingsia samuiensis]